MLSNRRKLKVGQFQSTVCYSLLQTAYTYVIDGCGTAVPGVGANLMKYIVSDQIQLVERLTVIRNVMVKAFISNIFYLFVNKYICSEFLFY